MKYLVHTRPPADFCRDAIAYRSHLGRQLTGIDMLHCTLMTLYTDRDNEDLLASRLTKIKHPPVHLKTGNLAFFDNNSLVARVDSPGLQGLHNSVISALQDFVGERHLPAHHQHDPDRVRTAEQYGNPYCGPFYEPHITIGTANIDELSTLDTSVLAGHSWTSSKFYLARREDGWEPVEAFSLR